MGRPGQACARASARRLFPDRAPPVISTIAIEPSIPTRTNHQSRAKTKPNSSPRGLRFGAILAHQGGRNGRRCVGFAGAMAVAMAVDALVGWPGALFARIGHPVTWIGRLVSLLDRSWNRSVHAPPMRRIAGVA